MNTANSSTDTILSSEQYYPKVSVDHGSPVVEFSKASSDQDVSIAVLSEKADESLANETVVEPEEKLEGWKRYLGLMFAFTSTLLFSLNQVILKLLVSQKNPMHPINLGTFLFFVCFILNLPLLFYRKCEQCKQIFGAVWPLWNHQKALVLSAIRGIASCGSFILFFYALKDMDVGDAVVIVSSAPVFVYILGWIFLKEKIGILIVITAFLALGGVVVIMRPPFLSGEKDFSRQLIMGSVFCLIGTFGVAVGIVTLRALKHVHHALLNFVMYTIGVIICIIPGFALGKMRLLTGKEEIVLLCLNATLTLSGQTFLVLALEYEQAGVVALIRTLGVVLAFLWQYAIYNKPPDGLSILGTVMILTGVILTIVRKWLSSLPEDHHYRRRFRYLLY